VCDLETSRMGAPYIYDISRLRVNWREKCIPCFSQSNITGGSSTRLRVFFLLRTGLERLGPNLEIMNYARVHRCCYITKQSLYGTV